jgi:hypothetical protein
MASHRVAKKCRIPAFHGRIAEECRSLPRIDESRYVFCLLAGTHDGTPPVRGYERVALWGGIAIVVPRLVVTM